MEAAVVLSLISGCREARAFKALDVVAYIGKVFIISEHVFQTERLVHHLLVRLSLKRKAF